jgi:3,4-dihydroxy-2-butanone 4-phosphate synthase
MYTTRQYQYYTRQSGVRVAGGTVCVANTKEINRLFSLCPMADQSDVSRMDETVWGRRKNGEGVLSAVYSA